MVKPKLLDIESAGFQLDNNLRAWLADKFPTIDPDGTVEIFTDKALSKGWVYASWPAAFRNYVRNGKRWGGVVWRSGLDNPEFAALMPEAKALGFRMPYKHESPGVYRTALKDYDKRQASSQRTITMPLKRVPK